MSGIGAVKEKSRGVWKVGGLLKKSAGKGKGRKLSKENG